jgi:hypothetical protein
MRAARRNRVCASRLRSIVADMTTLNIQKHSICDGAISETNEKLAICCGYPGIATQLKHD